MLAGLVRMATASAVDAARPVIRDTVRRAVLLAVALFLLVLVIVFAELAFYLWLRTQTAPHYAALIVAGVTLVVMLLILLIGLSGGSSSHSGPDRAPARTPSRADIGEPRSNDEGAATDPVARLVADAEAMGQVFGRDAKGYQLVLGAFVVGMLLGRK